MHGLRFTFLLDLHGRDTQPDIGATEMHLCPVHSLLQGGRMSGDLAASHVTSMILRGHQALVSYHHTFVSPACMAPTARVLLCGHADVLVRETWVHREGTKT
jgi:hypothetical protein